MILPTLLLALSVSGQTVQSLDCANFVDRATRVYSNAHGLKIALRVHAADDHIKQTHLCQTDYSFVVTQRDGPTKKRDVESIDDSWGRSVKFWIDGFALQGRRLFATIVERGKNPTFQIIAYNLQSEKIEIFEIPPLFIKRIPFSCQDSLRAIGMTRQGDPVVEFKNAACNASTIAWRLKRGPVMKGVQMPSRPIRMSNRSDVEPIVLGETTSAQ